MKKFHVSGSVRAELLALEKEAQHASRKKTVGARDHTHFAYVSGVT